MIRWRGSEQKPEELVKYRVTVTVLPSDTPASPAARCNSEPSPRSKPASEGAHCLPPQAVGLDSAEAGGQPTAGANLKVNLDHGVPLPLPARWGRTFSLRLVT